MIVLRKSNYVRVKLTPEKHREEIPMRQPGTLELENMRFYAVVKRKEDKALIKMEIL